MLNIDASVSYVLTAGERRAITDFVAGFNRYYKHDFDQLNLVRGVLPYSYGLKQLGSELSRTYDEQRLQVFCREVAAGINASDLGNDDYLAVGVADIQLLEFLELPSDTLLLLIGPANGFDARYGQTGQWWQRVRLFQVNEYGVVLHNAGDLARLAPSGE
jgi:hypothetical protein